MRSPHLCLAALLLLAGAGAGAASTAALAVAQPASAPLEPILGFWHYAIQQTGLPTQVGRPLACVRPATLCAAPHAVNTRGRRLTDHRAPPPSALAHHPVTQLAWAVLPAERAGGTAAAPVKYAVQRWPTATMPAPGQPGYLDSLLQLQYERHIADGTWTAVDAGRAPAPAGGEIGGARPFYRVLALASTGQVLAATRPSQAFRAEGQYTGARLAAGACLGCAVRCGAGASPAAT